jgi:TolB-like protein/Tfp pilus assembly protein PilF
MSLFNELKRRNVFRVGMAYIVAAWVFLQVADLVLEAINAPDWVLQTLMLLIGLGFIAALIIAWAYELTPEGIKREREVQRGESITHHTANKLNHITIALVLVGVAIVVADRLMPEQPEPTAEAVATTPAPVEPVAKPAPVAEPPIANDEKSVAVLPFVNMSSDPEQEFFSDGISEEILNVLTRIPGLKVAARTSSFQFKGQNRDIADIARQLKVNHILEGSVRKAGNQLRITAQLIEAESGFHLWSDTFDRQLEDVFAIQDEIAGAIAGELRARLADEELTASTPVDMQAYDLYLKGRALVSTRRGTNLLQAIELLQQVLDIAADYAPAMASMAKAYVVLPYFSEIIPVGTARAEARRWAEQALQIEPDNTEALAVMGIVHNEVDLDPEKALEVLERAVQANPGSAVANNFLGDIYTRIGDLERAMIYEAKAAELDPLSPVMLTDLGNVHVLAGELQKVIELANRALELDPDFSHALVQLTDVNFMLGNREAFDHAAERMSLASTVRKADMGTIQLQSALLSGQIDQARSLLEQRVKLIERDALDPTTLAFEAVALGDFDLAGRLLQLAFEQGDGTWAFPLWVRLPEQAPDSEPWQAFWELPGPARFAKLRRKNGLDPNPPGIERYWMTP